MRNFIVYFCNKRQNEIITINILLGYLLIGIGAIQPRINRILKQEDVTP